MSSSSWRESSRKGNEDVVDVDEVGEDGVVEPDCDDELEELEDDDVLLSSRSSLRSRTSSVAARSSSESLSGVRLAGVVVETRSLSLPLHHPSRVT